MASETTKLQVNFKLMDGTLINLYADNAGELESLLTTVQDTAPLIQGVSQSLGNSVRSSAVPNNQFVRQVDDRFNPPAAQAPATARRSRREKSPSARTRQRKRRGTGST